VSLHNIPIHFKVLKEKTNKLGFDLYVVDVFNMLDTPNPYGYGNDAERFIVFQQAVLSWVSAWNHRPDVIHCHDHHSGLIPFMMNYSSSFQSLKNIPTVFTIHSAQYQGWLGWDHADLLPSFDLYKWYLLEWKGVINPMASAIKCCWRFTTVSPGYLNELFYDANGLEELINYEQKKASGILNGIDAQVWNPEEDAMLESTYSRESVKKGKRKNKAALCETFHLDPDQPIISFIGRLVPEKGADLLAESVRQSLNNHPGSVNFLVLGSGVDSIENSLKEIIRQWSGSFNCYIGYHEKLSHLIYAGSDFLLMPSRVEPCGLNQLYALRYGTIPMVRSTGGLRDTVKDFSKKKGFGIRFDHATVNDICIGVDRAIELFNDTEKLNDLRKKVMELHHSWDTSAKKYLDLYESLK